MRDVGNPLRNCLHSSGHPASTARGEQHREGKLEVRKTLEQELWVGVEVICGHFDVPGDHHFEHSMHFDITRHDDVTITYAHFRSVQTQFNLVFPQSHLYGTIENRSGAGVNQEDCRQGRGTHEKGVENGGASPLDDVQQGRFAAL
jgi:hypothetical protein